LLEFPPANAVVKVIAFSTENERLSLPDCSIDSMFLKLEAAAAASQLDKDFLD
jgi:hypothetical protein